MGRSAERVLAALNETEQTETEIAITAGLSLGEVQAGLDELALDGAISDRVEDGLRIWRLKEVVR
jgi:predicted Rossmann fold nucleotide-binding protein DprA/Smf involved in DNA uptake